MDSVNSVKRSPKPLQAFDWKFKKSQIGHMKTASVTELKNGLSAYLECVQRGHRVVVTDHQRPIAVLERLPANEISGDLIRMAARGLISLPKEQINVEAFLQMPKPEGPAELLKAVSEDRSER